MKHFETRYQKLYFLLKVRESCSVFPYIALGDNLSYLNRNVTPTDFLAVKFLGQASLGDKSYVTIISIPERKNFYISPRKKSKTIYYSVWL